MAMMEEGFIDNTLSRAGTDGKGTGKVFSAMVETFGIDYAKIEDDRTPGRVYFNTPSDSNKEIYANNFEGKLTFKMHAKDDSKYDSIHMFLSTNDVTKCFGYAVYSNESEREVLVISDGVINKYNSETIKKACDAFSDKIVTEAYVAASMYRRPKEAIQKYSELGIFPDEVIECQAPEEVMSVVANSLSYYLLEQEKKK